ncbi:MAG: protein kinase, partial [Holophagales bacterium]|nr:protein kinase [Holophagales bacterium]
DGGTLATRAGRLGAEACAELVRQAAEGLHAAHREGLVHRDVKPSNLLVERGEGERHHVRVSDFGIARRAGSIAGHLAGTPAYLAPEMLDEPSRIDRRVDVYGLGVCLYELLSGRRPFEGEEVFPMLEAVRRGEALPLNRAAPDLPRDLVAIVERAMARRPAARYASARELADELRRFLDGQPVEAVTSTAVYRLSKYLVRYRRRIAAGGALALLLLLTSVTAGVAGLQARSANQRAETRRVQAEDLITFMLGDLRQRLAAVGRLDVLDAVGRQAMEYFSAVPHGELSTAELARRSRALYQIGEVRLDRGQLEEALAPLGESLALSRELCHRSPEDGELLFELGQSEFWVGYAAWKTRRLEEARRHFEAYLRISERLVAIEPENPDFRLELAYAHSNLGSLAEEEGNLNRARERFERVLGLVEALLEEAPEDPGLRFEFAAIHNQLGTVERRQGHLREALEHFRRDHEIRQQLAAEEPENRLHQELLGTSHDYLADLHRLLGSPELETRHLESANGIFRRLISLDPTNAEWRYKGGLVLLKQAGHQLEHRQVARAGLTLDRLEEVAASLSKPDSPSDAWHRWLVADTARLRAEQLRAEGRIGGAVAKVEEALGELRRLVDEHPHSGAELSAVEALNLAHALYSAEGKSSQAARCLGEMRRLLEGTPPSVGRSRWLVGWILLHLAEGNRDAADTTLTELRRIGYAAHGIPRDVEGTSSRGATTDRSSGSSSPATSSSPSGPQPSTQPTLEL